MMKKYALNYHTKHKEQAMKPRQKLTSLFIGLLIIASLISACSPVTAATAPAAQPTAVPAKVEAPKAAEPAATPQPAFDLNAKVSDFVTNLPDGYFGNAPIVTYCAVGQRGAIAMTALRLLGYINVKSLSGGFSDWVKANLPVKK